jgi:hypothetical protein
MVDTSKLRQLAAEHGGNAAGLMGIPNYPTAAVACATNAWRLALAADEIDALRASLDALTRYAAHATGRTRADVLREAADYERVWRTTDEAKEDGNG